MYKWENLTWLVCASVQSISARFTTASKASSASASSRRPRTSPQAAASSRQPRTSPPAAETRRVASALPGLGWTNRSSAPSARTTATWEARRKERFATAPATSSRPLSRPSVRHTCRSIRSPLLAPAADAAAASWCFFVVRSRSHLLSSSHLIGQRFAFAHSHAGGHARAIRAHTQLISNVSQY